MTTEAKLPGRFSIYDALTDQHRGFKTKQEAVKFAATIIRDDPWHRIEIWSRPFHSAAFVQFNPKENRLYLCRYDRHGYESPDFDDITDLLPVTADDPEPDPEYIYCNHCGQVLSECRGQCTDNDDDAADGADPEWVGRLNDLAGKQQDNYPPNILQRLYHGEIKEHTP